MDTNLKISDFILSHLTQKWYQLLVSPSRMEAQTANYTIAAKENQGLSRAGFGKPVIKDMGPATPKILQKKILFIEDNPSMQTLVESYLSRAFDVTTLDNCMEAITFLQNGELPDLIVTDLDTPFLNGFELLLQIRNSGLLAHIPVIILSANEDSRTRVKCLNAGADDYVVKPFNPRELEARIKVVLRRTSMRTCAA